MRGTAAVEPRAEARVSARGVAPEPPSCGEPDGRLRAGRARGVASQPRAEARQPACCARPACAGSSLAAGSEPRSRRRRPPSRRAGRGRARRRDRSEPARARPSGHALTGGAPSDDRRVRATAPFSGADAPRPRRRRAVDATRTSARPGAERLGSRATRDRARRPRDLRGEARAAAGAAPRGGPRRPGPAVAKQHAKGKYTARERIEKLLDPGSLPGARRVRPPSHDRLRDGRRTGPRRRRRHRPRHDRRAPGVRLQPGLHGLRRLARRGDGARRSAR